MLHRLLLVASFGTTHKETCERNIGGVEEHLANAFPEWAVRRAFTSTIVRRALAKRDTQVDDVPTALARAKAQGFSQVVIQPTHLLYGEEYEKLCTQTAGFSGDFSSLVIGKPLLADTPDLLGVAEAVSEAFPPQPGTALVLMGHGTRHHVNPVYAALQTAFHLAGRRDVVVGTVEAWPGIDEVAAQVKAGAYQRVTLAPLMLVAGDHAVNDLAGPGEDSWRWVLEALGLGVAADLRGLGEFPAIRALYEAHTRAAIGL